MNMRHDAARSDTDDAGLRARIITARRATLDWLDSMQVSGLPAGVTRMSGAHDPAQWPGMLLPGTYNAVQCRALLGAVPADGMALSDWLLTHRQPDGVFRIPGMADDAVFKKPDPVETWRYIDFHVTNYTLGAIEMLTPRQPPRLDFIAPLLEPTTLLAWLALRDLRDPWQEGNNIVNLASFLLLGRAHAVLDPAAVDAAITLLFAWHDRLQEPATGFWGVGQSHDSRAALHAMAGSMHNFQLWYATGRDLAYHDRAADYALSQPTAIDSACIDVDLVDLLVHAHMMRPYRRDDICIWLRGKLAALLAMQNDDGGFPDERHGVWRQDGWVRGYAEPQGQSNSFATWFRWIAIAEIADLLWPGWQSWRFRQMLGIGYRRPVA